MLIGERLRNIREDNDKTQQEIADYLQIDIKTYCRYENSQHEIKATILVKLARFYNLSIDYLTCIIDSPKQLFENNNQRVLTSKQIQLIEAYEHSNMKEAIDRLLEIK